MYPKTDLKPDERKRHDKLWLYTAVQDIEIKVLPRVKFSMREVPWSDMTVTGDHLALVGEEFAILKAALQEPSSVEV